MKSVEIPEIFKKEKMDMYNALKQTALMYELSDKEAKEVFDLLPDSLKNTVVFRDAFRNILRYEYGNPYDVGSGFMYGTDQALKVDILFRGVRALIKGIKDNNTIISIMDKLQNKDKHYDVISELDPLIRISINFIAKYEPNGCGANNKKVDWVIEFGDGMKCLIEVKNRVKELIKEGRDIFLKGKEGLPKAPPSPEGIFKSIEEKFLSAKKGIYQGVWIITNIYYDEDLTMKFFNELDEEVVQFAILTHLGGEARIFTKKEAVKKWLIEKFNLREMKKRV